MSGDFTTKWTDGETSYSKEFGYNGFVLGSRIGFDTKIFLLSLDFMYDFITFPKKNLRNDSASLMAAGVTAGMKFRRYHTNILFGIYPYTVLKGKNEYQNDASLTGYSAKIGVAYELGKMANINLEFMSSVFSKHKSGDVTKKYKYTISQVEYDKPTMSSLILTLSAPLPFY
jgi:hypothetical protein